MAILTIVTEQRTIESASEIEQSLLGFGISYERWPILPGINESSSGEQVLSAYADRVERVMKDGGYTKVDVIDVTAITPGLDAMLAKFSAEHWHDEDEVRFTVQGRGVYHVHSPEGVVAKLEVGPGDMIRVPR